MSPDDENFVEHLREQYQAPSMTGADITRFDARLASRRRGRTRLWWMGAMATMSAAVLLAVGLWDSPAPSPMTTVSPSLEWQEALTFDDLDTNPFAFLDLESAMANAEEENTYTIETDWPDDFDGLSYLIEPVQKEI